MGPGTRRNRAPRGLREREHAGGHIHGALASQRRTRIGYTKPTTGDLPQPLVNAAFETTWFAPEFAQELKTEYQLRYVPKGETEPVEEWFYGTRPFATRADELLPMYFGTEVDLDGPYYDLVGKTAAHPDNTYYAPGMNIALRRAARAYFVRSRQMGRADKTKVTEISLPYGGRFDAGRYAGGNWGSCGDANLSVCWGYSHWEHRFGTEIDLKPYLWDHPNPRTRREIRSDFTRALQKAGFETVIIEGNHVHARVAGSIFN